MRHANTLHVLHRHSAFSPISLRLISNSQTVTEKAEREFFVEGRKAKERKKRNCSGDLFMQNKCFGLRHVVEEFAAIQFGRSGGRQIVADRKSIAVNAEILPVDNLAWLVVAAARALERKV